MARKGRKATKDIAAGQVLIVSSNPSVLMEFSEVLSAEGYSVSAASSAAEAIAAAKLVSPSVIVFGFGLGLSTAEDRDTLLGLHAASDVHPIVLVEVGQPRTGSIGSVVRLVERSINLGIAA